MTRRLEATRISYQKGGSAPNWKSISSRDRCWSPGIILWVSPLALPAGPLWLTVELMGMAAHAGSVPMPLRRDALTGAAEVITGFHQAVKEAGGSAVGTVGNLQVHPNSRNIIPNRVTFTVKLRDIDMERRHRLEETLTSLLQEACRAHRLQYRVREDARSAPRYCAPELVELLSGEARSMGLAPPRLMSGPFHDALALADVCDFGMIFVRSKDGISHHPQEYSSPEDIALATELLYRATLRLSQV